MKFNSDMYKYKQKKTNPKKDEYCIHPNHNPILHLVIRPGETYIRICPVCKKEFKIKGKMITC